jgi:hypothetical protein
MFDDFIVTNDESELDGMTLEFLRLREKQP